MKKGATSVEGRKIKEGKQKAKAELRVGFGLVNISTWHADLLCK